MTRFLRLSGALVALCGLAACGRQATMSDDLQRDLDQASTAGVELAPRARTTAVVSALELGQTGPSKAEAPNAAPRAPERTRAPQRAQRAPSREVVVVSPRAEPQPEAQPVATVSAPEADAPAPTASPAPTVDVPAPQPSPMPAPDRGREPHHGRHGGWWSTGDVIRHAPFPINP